jgi:hypothetical protein
MNEAIQSLKAPERSHDNGDPHGWPQLSASEPFMRDLFLSQFLNSLLVRAKLLKQCVDLGSAEEEILAEARHAIANFSIGTDKQAAYWKNRAWTEAYRIELLLLLAEPPARLIPELEYRLSRAEAIGLANGANLRNAYQRLTSSMGTEDQKSILADHNLEINLRSILIETVKRIQWHETKKYLSRVMVKIATRNIVFAALFAFALFISPYVLMFLEYYFSVNILDHDVHKWVGFPLFACLSAGLFGSYFSRLLYIQQYSKTLSYDELVVTPDIVAIIVRGSVGICGAALLYFFLHAGIIEGPFIPDFSKFAMQLTPETPAQYPRLLMVNNQLALLIVWSFLAGFSERLVPSVLATTESKLGNGARPTPQPGLR